MLTPLFVYGKIIFYNFKRRKTSLRYEIKNVIYSSKKKFFYITRVKTFEHCSLFPLSK